LNNPERDRGRNATLVDHQRNRQARWGVAGNLNVDLVDADIVRRQPGIDQGEIHVPERDLRRIESVGERLSRTGQSGLARRGGLTQTGGQNDQDVAAGFTARLIDTPACRRFDLQTGVFAPAWSRKLGAAFRSPVTTFSRHYEVIAPDLRLRLHTEFRFRRGGFGTPSLRPVSKPYRGEIYALNLFPAPSFGALAILSGLHSPSGFCKPSGSKRSAGVLTKSPPYDSTDGLPLPAALSFDGASDQRSRLASSRSAIVLVRT